MFGRWLLPLIVIVILNLAFSAGAHVPINAADNNGISSAQSVEKATKSYVFYGHLHDSGDSGYYRLILDPGDRLIVSLMIPGFDTPVPDMVVLSPDEQGLSGKVPAGITIPAGYSADVISGKRPVKADYEPFSPAAIYKVASFSKEISKSGTYYVTIISTADESRYSIATGYLEEFSFQEWVLVPVNVLTAHLWEGQSIIEVLAPFLGTISLGFLFIIMRERKRGRKNPLWFWFAAFAALFYLGDASIILVQMIRALMITGFSGAAALTLVFFFLPVVLAIWLLRISRPATNRTSADRISLALAGILGLVFWAGMITGPVMSLIAAVIPDR